MAKEQLVSFIGSGNVAWHLAPALDNAGYIVKEVYSRNAQHAEALTERLYQAEVKASVDFSTSPSDTFIIATSDDSIADVAREIILPDDAVLVHTSGSQPMNVLQYAATPFIGVFYPLQTFSKSRRIAFDEVPILVESAQEETGESLLAMARAISTSVHKIFSEERKALHVAAVFASNFTNHMLTVAGKIAAANHLDFDLLQPLIRETIAKSLSNGPRVSQTGPAKRGDLEVLDMHMDFLQDHPATAEMYKVTSQHILDLHHGSD
ncbi:MAG TPA: DUF2520 domain-containing protein [Saprospirales bacterium]|nr:DUF2520 domain-containing protein [Saprospirales bacterium]